MENEVCCIGGLIPVLTYHIIAGARNMSIYNLSFHTHRTFLNKQTVLTVVFSFARCAYISYNNIYINL